MTREEELAAMLGVILGQIDYTSGACRPNEMVGACIEAELLEKAKALVREADANHRAGGTS